jgi:hypothetical protein
MFLIFSNGGWLRQSNTTGKSRMADMCESPPGDRSDCPVSQGADSLARSQMRIEASLMKAR